MRLRGRLRSYGSVWLLLHKIRSVFYESRQYPLEGLVEVDETLIGARGKGDPPGKDPGHKSIVVAAVEVRKGKGLGSLRLRKVADYTSSSLAGFVREVVAPGSRLETDAWASYDTLSREGYRRREYVSTRQPRGAKHRVDLRGVHLVFSNLKTWLRGRFHGVSPRYLPAYLAEFCYRFNRRHSPPDLFGWVARRLVQGEPASLRDVQQAYATG
jgi:hypothetical protein